MHGHESELLTTTFLMLSAVSFGLILRWLKQPPLVGYILAGLALGPAGLELVDYSDEISSLAEFGVILLLFIIGIELSVKAVLDAILPLQSLLLVVFFVSIGLLVDLDYVKSHWGVVAAVTLGVLFIKTLFGWALLSLGGEPVGRALVSSLVTPQIGEFSFVLTTSGVASGIFTGFEADFLLAVIAASLFISPIWSGVLHYLVVRYRIHDPDPQPSVVPDNE
jgi:Kef-type K+ transport system membrane component KefB